MTDNLMKETCEALDLSMTKGCYSMNFARELADHVKTRNAHVHMILDEIAALEKTPNARSSRIKEATPFIREPLKGLWHKHYFQPKNMLKNIINHWNKERLQTIEPDRPDRLIYKMMMDGYFERSQRGELTGEWIVFAKHEGRNFYLTLGDHGDDLAILERVLKCCGEFPQLEICETSTNSSP